MANNLPDDAVVTLEVTVGEQKTLAKAAQVALMLGQLSEEDELNIATYARKTMVAYHEIDPEGVEETARGGGFDTWEESLAAGDKALELRRERFEEHRRVFARLIGNGE